MLSQLGLPASNRDTLTLIHSTGEVLSLACLRESTNTDTLTPPLGQAACTNPPSLFQFHISLSLSLFLCSSLYCFLLSQFVSLLLSKHSFPSSTIPLSVIFVAVYFSICVSFSYPPFSLPSCQYQSLFISTSNSLTPLHSYMVSPCSPPERYVCV